MYARWLLATVILGLSFGAAYWAGLAARKANQPPAMEVVEGLAVATADLDMGDVWEEKGVAWKLSIRNQSPGRIEIHDIQQTCGCTEIKPRRLSIAAGETATIDLTLDLTHRTYSDYGQARRPFAVVLYPVLNPKSRQRLGWKLHGTIVSRVTIEPLAIDFGERPVHGETPVTQKVIATVHVPCQRLEAIVKSEVATATVIPHKDDNSKFEIVLAANPDLPPGKFQADVRLFTVSPNGEKALGVALPVSGIMQPEVRLLPARLILEAKRVGEIAEAVVTLQASPDAKVAVDHIEIDNPDLHVEPVVVEGILFGRAFRVRRKVTKAGEQVGEVRFVIRKPDKKLITLPVQVCCRGEAKSVAKNAQGNQP
jgi:hypothetical protein